MNRRANLARLAVVCHAFIVLMATPNAFAIQINNETELDQLFASAIKAVGGEQAVQRIHSIDASARCIGPNGNYYTSITSFRTGNTHFYQSFENRKQDTNLFISGDQAWQKLDGENNYSIVPPFQKLVVQLHEYQKMAIDFPNLFTDFALAGSETFNNRPSVKVSCKNELGGDMFLFFDTESGLFSGYVLPIPDSDESVTNVVKEWMTVGDVKLPSKIIATDSAGDWELNFEKIILNQSDESSLTVPPRVNDLAHLMAMHEQQKVAHMTNNAELFVDMFAEDVTQLSDGEVESASKAENLERIRQYFSQTEFQEWENIKPPMIRISQDGTMAFVIVEKRVRATSKIEQHNQESSHTVFAWLEVWQKIDGHWKITTVSSTRKTVPNESK